MPDSYPYHFHDYATADDGTERLPCKHCAPGRPCAEASGTFDPVPGTDATMFLQWKGTEVCLDFRCPCGATGHFDGWGAYFLMCPSCGSVYELGTQVRARLLAPDELPSGPAHELELDEEAPPPRTRPPGPAVTPCPEPAT